MKLILLIFCTWLFAHEPDFLLLIQVVTQPNEAEAFAIYNPTNETIALDSIYISDYTDYYQIQTGDINFVPSRFIAQFPDMSIVSGDTLHIALNQNYSEFYKDNFVPDLVMFTGHANSMLETDMVPSSFGLASNKIDKFSEMLILFYWDGKETSQIKDIDYFLWGNNQNAIYKPDVLGYNEDTPVENQSYFENSAPEGSSYNRIASGEEIGEEPTGGNGIFGHDETSEDFRQSWEITRLSSAKITTIYDIQENVEEYNGQEVTLRGVVTIGDDLLYPEKTKFYLQDNSGRGIQVYNGDELDETYLRGNYIEIKGTIELYTGDDGDYYDMEIKNPTITLLDTDYELPEAHIMTGNESEPMNGTWSKITGILTNSWDNSESNFFQLTISNDDVTVDAMYWNSAVAAELLKQKVSELHQNNDLFSFEIFGVITFYNGNPQLTCGYLEDLTISEHEIVLPDQLVFKVSPHPFIPSRGEKINYTYSIPNGFRCVIRVFDISGRFITTLFEGVPIFFDVPEKIARWDGRNHLGQLSTPGVYLIHLEATKVNTGKSFEKIAPIVIGLPVK